MVSQSYLALPATGLPDVLVIAFFRSRYADHRVLLSFPTRRSSDLPRAGSRRCARPAAAVASRGPGRRRRRARRCPAPAGCAPPRSEEHTSELQSRENLVCRLLLEKKKPTSRTRGGPSRRIPTTPTS